MSTRNLVFAVLLSMVAMAAVQSQSKFFKIEDQGSILNLCDPTKADLKIHEGVGGWRGTWDEATQDSSVMLLSSSDHVPIRLENIDRRSKRCLDTFQNLSAKEREVWVRFEVGRLIFYKTFNKNTEEEFAEYVIINPVKGADIYTKVTETWKERNKRESDGMLSGNYQQFPASVLK